ncbi:MAG: head GIN domain-containing protein [Salinimicrobium sp.]
MKNSTKFLILAAVFFAGLQLKAQDINASLEPFKEVKTFRGIEVIVFPSEENRITITGHSKEKVKYEVVEGRLEIKLPIDNIWSDDNTLIKVYGDAIEIIDANEGSRVQVENKIEGNKITFRAQEGASIESAVEAEKVVVKVISGGKITLEGRAREQQVETNTGGIYYGKDLKTKHTDVSAGTAGRAEVFATKYCKASARIGGIVHIFGSPDKVDHKTSLGGKIL